jgi:hypothetical protein
MKWIIRKKGGFKIGEAIDGFKLIRKIISIPAYKSIYYIISYYTAEDTRILARPSRSIILRPKLAFVADKMKIIPESVYIRMP